MGKGAGGKRHPPNARDRYKGTLLKADPTDDPHPAHPAYYSRPGSSMAYSRPGSAMSVGRPGDSSSAFLPPPPAIQPTPSRSSTPAPSRSAAPSRATTPAFGRRASDGWGHSRPPSRSATPAVGPSMLDDDLEDFDLTQLPSLTTIDGDELPLPIFPHPFSRPDSSNAIYDPFWFLTAWKAFPEESVFIGALLLTDYWLASEVLPPTLLVSGSLSGSPSDHHQASLKALFQVWVADSPSRSEVHETVKALWVSTPVAAVLLTLQAFLKTVHISSIDRILSKAEVTIISTSHNSDTEDEAVLNMFQQMVKIERGVKSYVKLQGTLFDLGKKKATLKARHGTLDEAAKAICWLLALGMKCALECRAYTSAACYCPYHAVLGQPGHDSSSEPLLNLAYTSVITLVQDMAKVDGPEASVIPTMFQMMKIDVAAALSTTFFKPAIRHKVEPLPPSSVDVVVQPKEETAQADPVPVRLSINFSWLQQTIYLASNQPFRHMADIWRKVVTGLADVSTPPRFFIFLWNGQRLGMEERPMDVRMGRKANIFVLDAADIWMASMVPPDDESPQDVAQAVPHVDQPPKEPPTRPDTPPPPPAVHLATEPPKAPRSPKRSAETPKIVGPKDPAPTGNSPPPGFATPKDSDLVPGNRVRTLAARFSTISLNVAAAPLRPTQSRNVSGPQDLASRSPVGITSLTNGEHAPSTYGGETSTPSRPATPSVGSSEASSAPQIPSLVSSPTQSLSQTLSSALDSPASATLPLITVPAYALPNFGMETATTSRSIPPAPSGPRLSASLRSKSNATRQAATVQSPVEGKATWSSIKTSAGRLFKQ
ncbi:uncharacterized protein LOC62_02G002521 [Vanrija pseudolonga]|uniref:Ubiquitin-like domain-containing protein n=1 Tax=Vanrija pseudolonga TaxID=143232 RepID=A0AAF0Y8Q2_9TREE|nr:hypothetical protein LOC62_02G002521 [Vanrija pseudolonga]